MDDKLKSLIQDILSSYGRCTILVSNAALRERIALACAQNPQLEVGVEVQTPLNYIKSIWELWGDGRRSVDPLTRKLLLHTLLEHEANREVSSLAFNSGTVEVLATLAKALPPQKLESLVLAESQTSQVLGDELLLSTAESELLRLVSEYHQTLADLDLVEPCDAATILSKWDLEQGFYPVVCYNLVNSFGYVWDFLAQLAVFKPVMFVQDLVNPLAQQDILVCVDALKKRARLRHAKNLSLVSLDNKTLCESQNQDRKPQSLEQAIKPQELKQLTLKIFNEGAHLYPTGAVEEILSAGRLSEAELLAKVIDNEVKQGAQRVVISHPQVEKLTRELAPKLHALGFNQEIYICQNCALTVEGRALISFILAVTNLVELSQTWPAPMQDDEGNTYVRLGDMSWWPPSDIVDFLYSGLSFMEVSAVQKLDKQWRQNRLLTPAGVLKDLTSARLTSRAVVNTTRYLMEGKIGRAFSALAREFELHTTMIKDSQQKQSSQKELVIPVRDVHPTYLEGIQRGMLSAGTLVAKKLHATGFGITQQAPHKLTLSQLAQVFCELFGSTALRVKAQVPICEESQNDKSQTFAPSSTLMSPSQSALKSACIVIASPKDAATFGAESFDIAIVAGQTSVDNPIKPVESFEEEFLVATDTQIQITALQNARSQFVQLVQLPKKKLILERNVTSPEGEENYPSIVLSELLEAYQINLKEETITGTNPLLTHCLSEEEVPRLIADDASLPQKIASEELLPTGLVKAELAQNIILSQPQQSGENGLPTLSASQIEAYLECPYKWFSMRRLNLSEIDATCSPATLGILVHRVLEIYENHFIEQNISPRNVKLEDRIELLNSVIAQEQKRQFNLEINRTRKSTPVIPHTISERASLDALPHDLASLVAYQDEILFGFNPIECEMDFGKEVYVEYAGVNLVGTIDRVDVDSHSQAVIVDYKHKKSKGFMNEYSVESILKDPKSGVLPRHVQALIYAQIFRRLRPQYKLVGALYLSTRGEDHVLSGAFSQNVEENIFGAYAQLKGVSKMAIPKDEIFGVDHTGFYGLLDACEEIIGTYIERMIAGDIEPNPCDKYACKYCPVLNCSKRVK